MRSVKGSLKSVLEKAYKPFFENPGPKEATLGDLETFLRSQGAKGVIDKCVTFFLAAAKEADIPLSPSWPVSSAVRPDAESKAARKHYPDSLCWQ